MDSILIWTDAARQPATGITAIGYVRLEASGAIATHACITGSNATSQRAELYAIVYALRDLPVYPACEVTCYTDCQPLAKRNRDWSSSHVWQMYDEIALIHDVSIQWIRRDLHPYNRLAHYLARQALREHLKAKRDRRK